MVNVLCSGPGPHVPASGILGTADAPVSGMLCPSTACQAPNVAAAQAGAVQDANGATLRQLAQAALVANPTDVAQDQTIQTQAATITAASITNLAAAAAAIGKLAQAVSLLAGNDINTKKELQALVRIVLQQFDSTAGT